MTGLVASLIGLGLGVLAALGLKALLKAFGITLPSAPLVFEARTVVVAIAVGVGVTVISAIAPARRAVRIPPVAALVDHGEDEPDVAAPARGDRRRRRRDRRRRLVAAGAGWRKPAIALVGLGALARVHRRRRCSRRSSARPLSSALGRPLAALLGMPGRLGRENSMRNPRRTAQTAAALMIGIALVSTIAVLGASLVASATQQCRQRDQRRLHHRRVGRDQHVGAADRLAAAGRRHGDDRLPGTVRDPRLAVDAAARSSAEPLRRPSTSTSPPAAALPRWRRASC